ncbi:MAG: UpxY family transcription antiterminator [Bacteroidaceae bacterium]|nr:UpxY family transcription antiterminator [Bacteroidaceae bacterium]
MDNESPVQWFVMRDLKRSNARHRAYRLLEAQGFTVFTPKVWQVVTVRGKRERVEIPYIPSLLFVRDSRERLDPIVERERTLQYHYLRHGWCQPMTVPDADMDRFMRAVAATPSPQYLLPSEITPQMYNRRIRIVGGPLDGQEGTLVTTRGSKTKRLLVELHGLLAVSVEVNPEYIRLVENS